MENIIPHKGKLLVSEPNILGDDSFSRSVVLVTEYNEDGVVGFILNKRLNYTLDQLIPEIDAELDVYQGGPVDRDNLYFLHNIPHLIPDSHLIDDDIYWGGDFMVVSALIKAGQITGEEIRFFLGYSGWEIDQLANELDGNSWIVCDNAANKELLAVNTRDIWKNHMKTLGGEYELWSNAPDNPQSN
ncbi:MAG: YqgE/AlgH family protein [Nonlabens sp.]